jgi:hypothetical protein
VRWFLKSCNSLVREDKGLKWGRGAEIGEVMALVWSIRSKHNESSGQVMKTEKLLPHLLECLKVLSRVPASAC